MILSASRRTDIPAYYMKWFMKRLDEGFFHVRNPINRRQVSEVSISRETLDCIVFWTKNALPFEPYMDELDDYMYYFLYTITGYDSGIERYLPPLEDRIENFKRISNRIGSERMIWRYDPILFTCQLDLQTHIARFSELCEALEGYANKVVVSWLDEYPKIKTNLGKINYVEPSPEQVSFLTQKLSEIAKRHNLDIASCAEGTDYSELGVIPNRCIDDQLVARLTGNAIKVSKDKNQRASCGCATSIEIGAYNSCKNGCLYCYANYSDQRVGENVLEHDDESSLLIGRVDERDKITKRLVGTLKCEQQLTMFDDR
ncbi:MULTISPECIES: DUF1848 domain-containing protein [unclassified Fusibacter]|uniref:DUF1848 domain-containing protein n=1 Tax=unclassified Fusibacter TaxID=2624464 RepID=UPI0013E90434|nr:MULTISPECIES: DUF1848 domain-containing protein [unclassified Fusibacter]MCK8058670.1 DUF1848 domain-containing protein [Fusibacter sp. A2]NPE21745.1 DUF1848 domain-containing protein [Fusibacter sp. A1]